MIKNEERRFLKNECKTNDVKELKTKLMQCVFLLMSRDAFCYMEKLTEKTPF